MEVIEHTRVEVQDSSQVGSARRLAGDLAREARLSEVDAGRAALIATELATNVLKHGGGGQLLMRPLQDREAPGVEVLALDRGRGIANLAASLRDGFSTAGTAGTGLGAVSRQADAFDVYSAPQAGVVAFARVGGGAETVGARLGVVCVAAPGEDVCGDGWAIAVGPERTLVMVVDGLGHGPGAADAADASRRTFARATTQTPREVIENLHAALRPTRGAAVAVTAIERARGVVRFAGVGNIAACLLQDGTSRSMVSHHGTAGHDARRIQEFEYALPRGGHLVMNSDGLVSSWDVGRYPGLLLRHPAVVAGVLYRDFVRGKDDATALVLEEPR